MNFSNIRNEKGFALISVYMAAVILLAISGSTFTRAMIESQEVTREISHFQTRSTAEAGLQSALQQIGIDPVTGTNSYSGYIDVNPLSDNNFISTNNTNNVNVGSFAADFNYPNQADWVTIRVTGTSPNDPLPITLQASVFLNSNFSKYMVYANTPTVWLGNNLTLGETDGTNPQGVSSSSADRNMLYYAGDLVFSGSNVNIYGDVHTEGGIQGNGSSWLHGDSYTGDFAINALGQVTNSGVTGGLNILDGFLDDSDRNGDGFINSQDYPDFHALTQNGGGDSHAFETINSIDLNFYATQAQSIPGPNGIDVIRYMGGSNRYLKLEANANGTTRIVEYADASYATPTGSQDLGSKNGIVYVEGDIFVQGEVQGRLTVVSSDDIHYTGDVKYAGGQSKVPADGSSSAAFLAKDKHYFLPDDLEVSGIMYGEKGISNGVIALDATYKPGNAASNYAPIYDGGSSKTNGHFRQYGNIVMNGTANTSVYQNDRAYVYDPNIKYYRPPGLPIRPEIRVIREAPNP